MRTPLTQLSPNRVRRSYRGGLLLDQLEGAAAPQDGNRPEDWLASMVSAVNPGISVIPGEGLTYSQSGPGKKFPPRKIIQDVPSLLFWRAACGTIRRSAGLPGQVVGFRNPVADPGSSNRGICAQAPSFSVGKTGSLCHHWSSQPGEFLYLSRFSAASRTG